MPARGRRPGRLRVRHHALQAAPAWSRIAMLDRLVLMGVELSIDDYGTGHSSLAYLRRLPVHELKIDRAFVRDLASDSDDVEIVRSTISLAHSLGLRVVAEGVEDATGLAPLQDNSCDRVQGFYLGRPVPAEVIVAQLRAAKRLVAPGL